MYGHRDTLAILDSRDPHGQWIVRIVGPEFGPEPDPIHPDHIPGALLDGCTLAAEYFPADADESADLPTRTLRMRAGEGLAELAERITLEPHPSLEVTLPPEIVAGLAHVLAFGDFAEYGPDDLERLEARLQPLWTTTDRENWAAACRWIERMNGAPEVGQA